jgi:hypothetical protein
MSYGLLSALSWGISTLLAAVAVRRIGALRTVVIGEAAGLAARGPAARASDCRGHHAGIAATVVGVMLAVTQHGPAPGTAPSSVRAPAIGVAFGLVAALCYSVGGFMIGRYTLNLGWLAPGGRRGLSASR